MALGDPIVEAGAVTAVFMAQGAAEPLLIGALKTGAVHATPGGGLAGALNKLAIGIAASVQRPLAVVLDPWKSRRLLRDLWRGDAGGEPSRVQGPVAPPVQQVEPRGRRGVLGASADDHGPEGRPRGADAPERGLGI